MLRGEGAIGSADGRAVVVLVPGLVRQLLSFPSLQMRKLRHGE